MRKRTLIPYTLLAVTGVAAIALLFRSESLKNELQDTTAVRDSLQNKMADYESIFKVDSMLIDGNYGKALQAYQENLTTLNDVQRIIPLRIAIAEKMRSLNNGGSLRPNVPENLDSLSASAASSVGVREADSLSFALEKTKVRLSSLRRQLQQKSFGEYMTFKSKKGNLLHYVGQVKNGKANGNGIAILETGSRYEGEWKDNERSGEGNFYWADGEHYEGSYANDMRNGLGTYYWPNKEKYVGEWKNDQRNGEGTFYGSDGKIVAKGIWKDDKLETSEKAD
ncbi:MAG: hypothetical protein WBG48_15305 [Pricia sp.]